MSMLQAGGRLLYMSQNIHPLIRVSGLIAKKKGQNKRFNMNVVYFD